MMINKDQGSQQPPPPENINHVTALAEKGVLIRGYEEYIISSTTVQSVRILKHNLIKLHFEDCQYKGKYLRT